MEECLLFLRWTGGGGCGHGDAVNWVSFHDKYAIEIHLRISFCSILISGITHAMLIILHHLHKIIIISLGGRIEKTQAVVRENA